MWLSADGMSLAVADRLGLLLHAVDEYAVFMLDPGGTVLTWNTGAERIKGYTADEIIGHHFSTFYAQEGIDAGKPQRLLATAVSDGHVHDEGWRVRKDGSRFWASVVITRMLDSHGRFEGFAKITHDDTGRWRAAEHDRLVDLIIERDRISEVLCETVVHRIYAAGLTLQGALGSVHEPAAVTRIHTAIDELDAALVQIRVTVADLQKPDE